MICPNCAGIELIKTPVGWYECPNCNSSWIGVK